MRRTLIALALVLSFSSPALAATVKNLTNRVVNIALCNHTSISIAANANAELANNQLTCPAVRQLIQRRVIVVLH